MVDRYFELIEKSFILHQWRAIAVWGTLYKTIVSELTLYSIFGYIGYMKRIIQFKIYKGENYYIGEGIDLPIVTQGKTLDEVVVNLKEALELHLEGEDLSELDLGPHPSVLVSFELDMVYA